MQIKYKSITVYIKNKKGGRRGAYIIVSKGTLHLKMSLKNTQNKIKQIKKNEIKKGSPLNYKIIMKHAFCFLAFIIFHQLNLLNIHKKCICFAIIF